MHVLSNEERIYMSFVH